MYRIISVNTGDEIGIVDTVTYIKVGSSGDYATATKDTATGVAVNSVAYDLMGHDEIGGADTVIVSEFDSGTLMAEMASYAELAAAIREGVNEV